MCETKIISWENSNKEQSILKPNEVYLSRRNLPSATSSDFSALVMAASSAVAAASSAANDDSCMDQSFKIKKYKENSEFVLVSLLDRC